MTPCSNINSSDPRISIEALTALEEPDSLIERTNQAVSLQFEKNQDRKREREETFSNASEAKKRRITTEQICEKGIKIWPNKEKYEGDLLGGKCHGFGILYSVEGKVLYKGDWENDLHNGDGFRVLPSGMEYTGKFFKGKFHGFGTLFDPAKKISHEGMWKHGVLRKGLKKYPNGEVYKGELLQGRAHGLGTFYSPEGTIIYSGHCENDHPHGMGTRIYLSGDQYRGEFMNGKAHGKGMLIWAKREKEDDLIEQEDCLIADFADGMLKENAFALSLSNPHTVVGWKRVETEGEWA